MAPDLSRSLLAGILNSSKTIEMIATKIEQNTRGGGNGGGTTGLDISGRKLADLDKVGGTINSLSNGLKTFSEDTREGQRSFFNFLTTFGSVMGNIKKDHFDSFTLFMKATSDGLSHLSDGMRLFSQVKEDQKANFFSFINKLNENLGTVSKSFNADDIKAYALYFESISRGLTGLTVGMIDLQRVPKKAKAELFIFLNRLSNVLAEMAVGEGLTKGATDILDILGTKLSSLALGIFEFARLKEAHIKKLFGFLDKMNYLAMTSQDLYKDTKSSFLAILASSLLSISEGINSLAEIDEISVKNLFDILGKIQDLSKINLGQNFVTFVKTLFPNLPALAETIDRLKNMKKIAEPFSRFMDSLAGTLIAIESVKAKTLRNFGLFIRNLGLGLKDMSGGLGIFVKIGSKGGNNIIKILMKLLTLQNIVKMKKGAMLEFGLFISSLSNGLAQLGTAITMFTKKGVNKYTDNIMLLLFNLSLATQQIKSSNLGKELGEFLGILISSMGRMGSVIVEFGKVNTKHQDVFLNFIHKFVIIISKIKANIGNTLTGLADVFEKTAKYLIKFSASLFVFWAVPKAAKENFLNFIRDLSDIANNTSNGHMSSLLGIFSALEMTVGSAIGIVMMIGPVGGLFLNFLDRLILTVSNIDVEPKAIYAFTNLFNSLTNITTDFAKGLLALWAIGPAKDTFVIFLRDIMNLVYHFNTNTQALDSFSGFFNTLSVGLGSLAGSILKFRLLTGSILPDNFGTKLLGTILPNNLGIKSRDVVTEFISNLIGIVSNVPKNTLNSFTSFFATIGTAMGNLTRSLGLTDFMGWIKKKMLKNLIASIKILIEGLLEVSEMVNEDSFRRLSIFFEFFGLNFRTFTTTLVSSISKYILAIPGALAMTLVLKLVYKSITQFEKLKDGFEEKFGKVVDVINKMGWSLSIFAAVGLLGKEALGWASAAFLGISLGAISLVYAINNVSFTKEQVNGLGGALRSIAMGTLFLSIAIRFLPGSSPVEKLAGIGVLLLLIKAMTLSFITLSLLGMPGLATKIKSGIVAIGMGGIALTLLGTGLIAMLPAMKLYDPMNILKLGLTIVGLSLSFAIAGLAAPAIFFGAIAIGAMGASLLLLALPLFIFSMMNVDPDQGVKVSDYIKSLSVAFSNIGLLGSVSVIAGAVAVTVMGVALTVLALPILLFSKMKIGSEDIKGVVEFIEKVSVTFLNIGLTGGVRILSASLGVSAMGLALTAIAAGINAVQKLKIDTTKIGEVNTAMLNIAEMFALLGKKDAGDYDPTKSSIMGKLVGADFHEGLVEQGIESVLNIGKALESLAHGLVSWTNITNKGFNPKDFKVGGGGVIDNISHVATAVSSVFGEIGKSAQGDGQGSILKSIFGTDMRKSDTQLGIESVSGFGESLKSIAEGLKQFRSLTDMGFGPNDFKFDPNNPDANEGVLANICRVATAASSVFGAIGKQEEGEGSMWKSLFGTDWSKTDAERGVEFVGGMGTSLKDISESLKTFKELEGMGIKDSKGMDGIFSIFNSVAEGYKRLIIVSTTTSKEGFSNVNRMVKNIKDLSNAASNMDKFATAFEKFGNAFSKFSDDLGKVNKDNLYNLKEFTVALSPFGNIKSSDLKDNIDLITVDLLSKLTKHTDSNVTAPVSRNTTTSEPVKSATPSSPKPNITQSRVTGNPQLDNLANEMGAMKSKMDELVDMLRSGQAKFTLKNINDLT